MITLRKTIYRFFVILIFSYTSNYISSMENKITLLHISNSEIIETLRKDFPSLYSITSSELGFTPLPESIGPLESQYKKQNPVWGTWVIMENDKPVGRIHLTTPNQTGRGEISRWLNPDKRSGGLMQIAQKILLNQLDPYIGKEVTVINKNPIINHEKREITYEEEPYTVKFQGFMTKIDLPNIASLISQLKLGARIVQYTQGHTIVAFKLYYPGSVVEIQTDEEIKKIQDPQQKHTSEKLKEIQNLQEKLIDTSTRPQAIEELFKLFGQEELLNPKTRKKVIEKIYGQSGSGF